MASAGATRDSVWWMRVLGPIGALILAAGFMTSCSGAVRAELSSNWRYCGEGRPAQTGRCMCLQGEITDTWWNTDTVCFTSAPASALAMANLGSGALLVGSLMLLSSVLLRLRRAGMTWLVVRSVLIGCATVGLVGLAELLVSGPPCLDCPSSPGDPGFSAAAIVTATAAVLVLGAAVVPVGFRIANRSRA